MPEVMTTELQACSDVVPGYVVSPAPRSRGDNEHHEHHELIFVVEGCYHSRVKREQYDLNPGSGIFPAGCRHSGDDTLRDGNTRLLVIQWSGACLDSAETAPAFADLLAEFAVVYSGLKY